MRGSGALLLGLAALACFTNVFAEVSDGSLLSDGYHYKNAGASASASSSSSSSINNLSDEESNESVKGANVKHFGFAGGFHNGASGLANAGGNAGANFNLGLHAGLNSGLGVQGLGSSGIGANGNQGSSSYWWMQSGSPFNQGGCNQIVCNNAAAAAAGAGNGATGSIGGSAVSAGNPFLGGAASQQAGAQAGAHAGAQAGAGLNSHFGFNGGLSGHGGLGGQAGSSGQGSFGVAGGNHAQAGSASHGSFGVAGGSHGQAGSAGQGSFGSGSISGIHGQAGLGGQHHLVGQGGSAGQGGFGVQGGSHGGLGSNLGSAISGAIGQAVNGAGSLGLGGHGGFHGGVHGGSQGQLGVGSQGVLGGGLHGQAGAGAGGVNGGHFGHNTLGNGHGHLQGGIHGGSQSGAQGGLVGGSHGGIHAGAQGGNGASAGAGSSAAATGGFTGYPVVPKPQPSFQTGYVSCYGVGKICVPQVQCVNGFVTLPGVSQVNQQNQRCNKASEVCCTLKTESGAESNGYLPPYGSSGSDNKNFYAKPPKEEKEQPEPEGSGASLTGTGIAPPTTYQLGCAAALKCVEEEYCTMIGMISDTPLRLTEEQKLRRVPMVDCKNPDTGAIGKCCRDGNYVDPWPAGGNLPPNYKGGFDERGFPLYLNLSRTTPSPISRGPPAGSFVKPQGSSNFPQAVPQKTFNNQGVIQGQGIRPQPSKPFPSLPIQPQQSQQIPSLPVQPGFPDQKVEKPSQQLFPQQQPAPSFPQPTPSFSKNVPQRPNQAFPQPAPGFPQPPKVAPAFPQPAFPQPAQRRPQPTPSAPVQPNYQQTIQPQPTPEQSIDSQVLLGQPQPYPSQMKTQSVTPSYDHQEEEEDEKTVLQSYPSFGAVIHPRPFQPAQPQQPSGPVKISGPVAGSQISYGQSHIQSQPQPQPQAQPQPQQPGKTFELPHLSEIPNQIGNLNPFKPQVPAEDTIVVSAPSDVPEVTTKKPGFFQDFLSGFGKGHESSPTTDNAITIPLHTPGAQCGIINDVPNPLKTSDVDVGFGAIPWQAMILSNTEKKLLCSGAIVAPNVVLTAAHCVHGQNPSDVSIKAGEYKLGYELKHEEPLPFEIVQVESIVAHPKYQPGAAGFDMALLFLEKSIKYDLHVDSICVPKTVSVPFYQRQCISVGWGKVILETHAAGALMHKIDVDVLNKDQCAQRIQGAESPVQLDDSLVCAKPHKQNNNMCQVDVGGPLACDRGDGIYELVGVYSQDTGCQPTNQVATFALVDSQWVNDMIISGAPQQPSFIQQTVQPAGPSRIHYHPQQPGVPCDCQQGTQPAGINQYLPPV